MSSLCIFNAVEDDNKILQDYTVDVYCLTETILFARYPRDNWTQQREGVLRGSSGYSWLISPQGGTLMKQKQSAGSLQKDHVPFSSIKRGFTDVFQGNIKIMFEMHSFEGGL